ncbi:SET domain-containing protein [Trametes versicolor FP-101664 SS1]|uniref:SET domain-containing protein n=1 Tax=Trametes versicolor (strain FP-101664) TaxID=717944 RepID=UPI0004623B21|nr:SET domain-containing protein [Trametes versicolor FP-101664 SS1]EIW56542.1 SET domain-containing protein [Trametes versicolor FP-101664 SS1]
MEHASLKSTPSATPPLSNKTKGKAPKGPAQLIGHLPRAEEDAMKTFTEIPGNHYQYGTLGKSREALESMMCDCQYEHGIDDPDTACGHDSDCINRLTQVECLPEDCRCRSYCRNQRFQRKQYAPIEIVKTEMKGFGLRAGENIPKDAFIYEYVGDVVSQPSFLKRMRQYAEEGIRHFYFMMLQKDEYIDATKRGGIGRFANHSCNPNCYVAKWTVGDHVRMGIFANRTIKQHEELTFNYNVDRYGHDAQICYCGEPNCVGFIGGKTQTDLAAMDDLYLDALGITEEVERFGLKGSKKKKGRKLDEDFIPDLKPIILRDVPKVVQAMRQTQSRKVLVKLLMRIKLTEELAALRQIMRLRGFSVMTNILEDYSSDVEVQTLAIECMATWPLIQRNKVEDSKVNVPVKLCAESENEVVAELAKKLLEQWESLEYAYRIPKRVKGETTEEVSAPILNFNHDSDDERPSKRVRPEDDFPEFKFSRSKTPPKHDIKYESAPVAYVPDLYQREQNRRAAEAQRQQDVAKIIAAAAAAATAEANKPKPEPKASSSRKSHRDRAEREREREARKAAKARHKKLSKEEREANKEKRLLKLIGAVVVRCMSKYKDQMDHDLFKKYAKETIAEKEKKSSSYKEGRLETLSEEKTTKIKKFAKEYIAKILRKLEKSGQRRKPSSTTASSSTPDGAGADDSVASAAAVADVMDLDPDETYEDHDDQGDDDHDEQGDEDDGASGSGSPEDGGSGETSPTVVADPRIRHPASSTSKDDDGSWDTDLQKPISSSWSAVPVGS